MRILLCKLLTACFASLVLFAFVGCGEEKSPPRYVDDKESAKPKDPNAR
jgi:hypothetical protein